MGEPFSKTDDFIDLEADFPVKIHSLSIARAHLDIDLRAAEEVQPLLGCGDNLPTETLSAAAWVNGKVIEPTPVPLVAGHDACDNSVIKGPNQEEFGLHGKLALDILVWIVGASEQLATFP